jgi:hypothetical protein
MRFWPYALVLVLLCAALLLVVHDVRKEIADRRDTCVKLGGEPVQERDGRTFCVIYREAREPESTP